MSQLEEMQPTLELASTLLVASNVRVLTKEERLCLDAVMRHLNAFHRTMEIVRLQNYHRLKEQYEGELPDDDESSGGLTQQPT